MNTDVNYTYTAKENAFEKRIPNRRATPWFSFCPKTLHNVTASFHSLIKAVWSALNVVRLQVLKAASMKMTTFWDMAQFNLAEVDKRISDASYNTGNTHHCNVGLLLRHYTAPYTRRLLSSTTDVIITNNLEKLIQILD
jgi:hypothetical protein